jgi:hypothetical protein
LNPDIELPFTDETAKIAAAGGNRNSWFQSFQRS